MRKKSRFTIKLMLLCLFLVIATGIQTYATEVPSHKTRFVDQVLTLESNSFNAKKRSKFSIAGQTEQTERGLTLIHFHSNEKFEFRTFDTHGDPQQAAKMTDILWALQKNKAY